ncbi:hypothetical protein QE152_g30999 [Popillia japonica]|uniref:Uncharacterized protein n=1 Tax=Popillia japonica TaxID=7064 RepID=A0AAW1JD33_POPJA
MFPKYTAIGLLLLLLLFEIILAATVYTPNDNNVQNLTVTAVPNDLLFRVIHVPCKAGWQRVDGRCVPSW